MQDKLNIKNAQILGTREKKIGATTFIVTTSVNTENKRDIGAIISRLIELEETA